MDRTPIQPGFARDQFQLDGRWTFLNHGSFGAVPASVRAAQSRWRDRVEAQPVAFLARAWWELVQEARPPVAALLGTRPRDIAFVANATAGVQAVVGSLSLDAGDTLVTTTHRYDAVQRILTRSGARVVEVDPGVDPTEDTLTDAILAACTPRTRLVVLDAVTSPTARVLPLRRVVEELRTRGVRVLVDGAHAPGQLEVDLDTLRPDYWVGNLHKWVCAPRGAAVLYVAPAHQSSIRPAVTSHGHGLGFHAEFDWPGTFDPSAWLSAPAAVAQHLAWGGPALRAAHRALAGHYRDRLTHALELTPAAPPGSPHDCAMVAVPLGVPCTGRIAAQAWLAERWVEAPLVAWGGQTWLRVSAFAAYNTPEDIEPLVALLPQLRTFLRQGA